MPTIADVAKLAGVSTATVSRVLNDSPLVTEATKKNVYAAIKEVGYELPVRNRTVNEFSKLIAVVTASTMPDVDEEVLHYALEEGYGMVILPTHYDGSSKAYFSGTLQLLEKQLLGVIVLGNPTWHHNENVGEVLRKYPLVQTFDGINVEHGCMVGPDNTQMGYDAAQYLMDLGCKRIAVASAVENRTYAQKRLRGYQLALLENEMELDATLDYREDIARRMSEEGTIAQLAEQIDVQNPPDGVVCVTDLIAMDMIRALQSKGLRVPEDVKVIGADNYRTLHNESPLISTVSPDYNAVAAEAVRMLIDLTSGRMSGTRQMVVPHYIIERGSTVQGKL